jgi:hypothetical protein
MTNKWILHIKKWAKNNNKSYACAVSDPECKNSYNKPIQKEKQNINKQKVNKLEYDLKLEREIKNKQKELKLKKEKEVKPKKETKKEIQKKEKEIRYKLLLDEMKQKELKKQQDHDEWKNNMKLLNTKYGMKPQSDEERQKELDRKYPPTKKELEKRRLNSLKPPKPPKLIKVPTLRMLENLKKKQEMTAGEYLKLKTERYIKNQKRKDLREIIV